MTVYSVLQSCSPECRAPQVATPRIHKPPQLVGHTAQNSTLNPPRDHHNAQKRLGLSSSEQPTGAGGLGGVMPMQGKCSSCCSPTIRYASMHYGTGPCRQANPLPGPPPWRLPPCCSGVQGGRGSMGAAASAVPQGQGKLLGGAVGVLGGLLHSSLASGGHGLACSACLSGGAGLSGSLGGPVAASLVQSALPAARIHGSGQGASTGCANSQHLAQVVGTPLIGTAKEASGGHGVSSLGSRRCR